VLDLTNETLLRELAVTPEELTSGDRRTCQELADLAAEAGFEGVIGPSAAAAKETTLAVFGPAIKGKAHNVTDLGLRRPPRQS
jgi:hypothetical protein